MKKIKIYKLNSGPKVVLYQDTSRHCALASLFVMFGGKNKEVIVNNKCYSICDGMAHFIEHLLIENSKYGNALVMFNKKNTNMNGYTSRDVTEYFIDSINNFKSDLEKLINIVNNVNFSINDIEETKKAIIKEKMMSKDSNFRDLEKIDCECLFKNIKYPNILGEVADIKTINYDMVKFCYDIFYQIQNQMLIVSGNFKIREIEKIIKDVYSNFDRNKIKYNIPKMIENNSILLKEKCIFKNIHLDYVRLNYKINIKNLSNEERLKLDFYLEYFLSFLFDSASKVYNYLVSSKICLYDIDYSCSKIDDFFVLKIGTATNKHNEFITLINDAIRKKNINRKDFERRKRKSIINIIMREDSLFNTVNPFIENIIKFNCDRIDKVEDIQKQSFADYKQCILNLDFDNMSVTKMLRMEENSDFNE